MRYEFFIGLRYLRARRKQAMISVVTFVSVFGVALGVAALIIVLAVMTGFEEDLREKILGTNAHIVIVPNDRSDEVSDYRELIRRIESVPGVRSVMGIVYGKVMVTRGTRSDGMVLKGIDPDDSGSREMTRFIIRGDLDDLRHPSDGKKKKNGGESTERPGGGIILGIELAASLGAKVGDTVTLTSSRTSLTPGGLIPMARAFRVVGYFRSGMYEYDRSMAFVWQRDAQRLIGAGDGVNGIEVRVRDIFDTAPVVAAIRRVLGARFWVRDWREMNRSFFSALKLEKIAMFIILILIVFVASFNIISSLTMMVMEKHKDIGILKAMGATNSGIHLIFLAEGVIIGLVGTVIGCLAGVAISWIADTYHLIRLAGEVYYISYLPFHVQALDVIAICSASLAISFLATLYPARQAAKLDPVEAIRYE